MVTPGSAAAADEVEFGSYVLPHASNPNNSPLPTLNQNSSSNYLLNDGVEFSNSAPMKCQGMQWTTKWTVSFQAVR